MVLFRITGGLHMSGCTCENWTLQDLSSALYDMHKDNKKIVVPIFQRGKRWNKRQESEFIDSIKKGYPVGTMLFYKTVEDNVETYILVDGLQRSNSVKKYMSNPTEFFCDENIPNELCNKVLSNLNVDYSSENYTEIRKIIITFIKKQRTFKNLQYYEVAKELSDKFHRGQEPIGNIIYDLQVFFEKSQNLYDKISNTVIPVIVYSGDQNNLPEIFERINSQGTPLDQYEIYAAAWPIEKRFKIQNTHIVDYIVKKYDTFVSDKFQIQGYDRITMLNNKEVNAFEYLFGLSKYLVNTYDNLGFNKKSSDDTVNPLAFELVNACLNDTDKISTLYKKILEINVDEFEQALYKTIDFVNSAIMPITKFKGNAHGGNKIFHSKYQIMSMISTTFKEMYESGKYKDFCNEWTNKKKFLQKNLLHYYVYDIITNEWSEGGSSKIYKAAKPNRYLNEIPSRIWSVVLDSYFEKTMQRRETKKIDNPRSEEYVILNSIYLNTFTAMDQLSLDCFDVEHIAPKDQMRNLIISCNGDGLPVSSIANLCYLPEAVNRSKKGKNFYQDKGYLSHINLSEVENKFSFTEKEDLEWMDIPYEKPEDFAVLKDYYIEYCTKRFEKIKGLFFASMNIKYDEIEPELVNLSIIDSENNSVTYKKTNFLDKCVIKLTKKYGNTLVKINKNSYKTEDDESGFVIVTSKQYKQGDREKYWFAYRKKFEEYISGCKYQYVIFSCKDEDNMLVIPIYEINKRLVNLNTSYDEDGNISHWHIVFFKDINGKATWFLSKPSIQEVDVTRYLLVNLDIIE